MKKTDLDTRERFLAWYRETFDGAARRNLAWTSVCALLLYLISTAIYFCNAPR